MGHLPFAHSPSFSHSPYLHEISHALFEAAEQAMFVVDEDERILAANTAACLLAGGSAEALQGVLLADRLPHPVTLVPKPLENGRNLLIVTPTPVNEGQPATLPQGLPHKADSLANSPYGFDAVSADGQFLYANPAYLKMWGYDSLEEILGTSPVGHCADPSVPEQLIRNLEAHGDYTLEFTARRKDRSTFQVLMSAQKVVDSQGVVTYEGTSIDITEWDQARAALRQSEANLQAIFNNSLQGFVLLDRQRQVLTMNSVAADLVAREGTRPFQPGELVDNLFPAAQLVGFADAFALTLDGQSSSHEIRIESPASSFWYEVHLSPVATNDGHITGVSLSFLDITGRKTAENSLQESEARLVAIIDSAMDAIVSLDEAQRIVMFNAAAQQMFGYTAEQAIGQLHDILLPERFRQNHRFHVENFGSRGKANLAMGTHRPTLLALRANGEEFPVEVSISQVTSGEKVVYTAIMRDITNRVEAEAALLASEERLRLFIDHAPAALAMFDRDMRYIATSLRWMEDFELGPEPVNGKLHYEIFPGIPERWKHAHQRGLAGEVVSMDEDKFVRLDGRIQWLRWELHPWYTADNRVGGILIFSEDITKRKEAEDAVKDLQAILSEAEAVANIGSWRWDLSTQKVTWSNQMFTLFGVDPATFDGDVERIISLRIHPDDVEAMNQSNLAVLQHRRPSPLEYRIVLPNGTVRTVWAEGRLIHDESGESVALVGYVQDITERKRTEAAIKELQELLAEAESVAQIGSFKWNVVTKEFTWSDGLYKLFQIDQESFDGDVNRAVSKRIHPDDWHRANHLATAMFVNHEPVSLEYRLVRPDGTEPVVWQDSRMIYDENGAVTAVIGYVQDITRRKAAEQALHDSEERYHLALENMLEGCQIISFDWRYLYVNASVVASSRRRQEEMLGRTMMEVFPGIEGTELFALLHRCMVERTAELFENKFVYDDGSFAWFNLSVQPVPEGLFILSVDITERKQAEEALRQSEARFSTAFQLSPAALSLTRQDGRIVDVNAGYERLSGYTREELIGRDATEVGIFTVAQRHDLRQRMIEQGGILNEAEMMVYNKSGELRYVLYSVKSIEIGDEIFALTLAFDITDRKQLETALKEMAENMATAQAITHSGSWELRLAPNGSVVSAHIWSDECYRIFGLEPGSGPVTVDDFYSMVHPDDLVGVRQIFQEGIAERKETNWEYRIIRPDGSIRTIFDQVKPLVDEHTGQLIKVVGLVQDITEGRRAEATIDQLNRRMEMILNSAGEGIYGIDMDGRITFINPTMAHMVGWEPADLLGKQAHAAFHHSRSDGTPYPPEECGVQLSVRSGQPYQNDEDTYWHQNGQPVLVDYTCTPISDAGLVLGSVMVVRDITERKKAAEQQLLLEAQLRQAQKMESIGRLAGGMAHDFNNQLAVIKLYGDLMRYRMPKDDPLLPKLEQIRQAVDRATHLTRQLLAFSRKQVLQPVVLDMNDLVTNLEKMLARLIGEDITLSTDLQPGLWPVTADPGQLEQVIMNLVINARDAMATGGMLTIETQNLILDETTLTMHQDALHGPAVMLAVTDTGHGMDETTRLQVFEPFFTTKEPGKGTGLGLATVHGIVKQSGGTIYVYSEPGQGTTFKIYLPASQGVVIDLGEGGQTAVPPPGHETILLVEDEEALRHLVRLTLEEIGYTILEAADGNAALALAAEHPDIIDLLLTDVVLPQKSGRKLAEELQMHRPLMRVLFMSGYMDDAVMRHGVLMAEMNFLSKPFSRSALASKVREVLEKPLP